MSDKLRLPASVRAWGTPLFADVLKRELAGHAAQLLLQQALAHSSSVAETPVTVLVGEVSDRDDRICATVGIFYEGIVSGCSCADDPAPDNVNTEYCRLQLEIERDSAACGVVLLDEE